MKIIKLSIAGLFAVLTFFSCNKNENQFTISGRISHAEGETIYLERLLVANTEPVDSVKIDYKGEFKLAGVTHEPAFFLLKLDQYKNITLLIDSLEQVNVHADAANFNRNYKVEGSPGSVQIKRLNDHLLGTRKKLDSIQSLRTMYRGNPDFETMNLEWTFMYDSIRQNQVDFSRRFVMENPFSLASIMAVYQKFDGQEYIIDDIHTLRVAATALNTIYPKSNHVKALYNNTLELMKAEQNAQLMQYIEEQGENSPDIVLPDPNGEEIALSSLRGKVVLLQFWSALDKNSRIQNEALLEAYNKYNKKGFEIYQVCIDSNRIEWVDAIDQDNLSWVNVGDMEGSSRATMLYNIQNVPYNYLLNGDGEIISQNLVGPTLDRTLATLLK